jgi:hypothetical protein
LLQTPCSFLLCTESPVSEQDGAESEIAMEQQYPIFVFRHGYSDQSSSFSHREKSAIPFTVA